MNPVSRRDFLKLSAAASVAAAVTPPFTQAATTAAPSGAGPFNRTGRPRLLLSLAAYSFRENFSTMRGKPNAKVPAGRETDMFKFIDYCAAQGCDGAELTSYFFAEETDAYMIALRRHAFLRGVAVSGTAIGNNFSLPKGPKLTAEIATTKKWIDRALLMGAQHIRVFAGNVPKGDTEAAAFERCVAGINKSLEYAAEKGVFLALENHGGITGTAEQLLKIVKAVSPSPWFGVNLDGGNFRSENVYAELEQIAPYAINAQVKVSVTPNGKKEPADLGRVIEILRKANYRGYVVLEYEEADPYGEIPKVLADLRNLIHG